MTEPQEPTWANKETEWLNGTELGPAEHQEMFKHLWNWHLGPKNGDVPSSPNGESLSDLISALNSTTESTGLQAAISSAKVWRESCTSIGEMSA